MTKIFIADDHVLIREGFKRLIERELGIRIIGEAGSAAETLEAIQRSDCDVLVLDISLPDKSGLELIKELKAIAPQLKILILTMHPEDCFAIRALKAGAAGYLTKVSAPTELVKAIHKIAAGGRYVSESLAEKLAFELGSTAEKGAHEALSDREFEVFRRIAGGSPVSEIARALHLSTSTVNTYRQRILEKLQLKSNAEIIYYAMRHNLLE